MALLIGTLSDASWLKLGRLAPQQVDANLGTILREYVEHLEPEAANRVQVETSPEAVLTGHWDPDMLQRVIAYVVSNALKFSPATQPIQVCLTSTMDSVSQSVTDHGIGIAEEELPHLFSRYGRAGGAVAAGVKGTAWGCSCAKGSPKPTAGSSGPSRQAPAVARR